MKTVSYLPIIGLVTILLINASRVISIFYSNIANVAIERMVLTHGDVRNTVEAVVAILEQAESWWPSNPTVPEAYGRIYFVSGQNQEAISWFLKSQQVRPENVITKFELGNAYDKVGDHDAAIQFLESAGAGSYALRNSDFEDFCDNGNLPCNWILRNAGDYSVFPDIGYLTGSSVRICSQENGGYLYQRVNTLSLTTYKLSGWIRTSDLSTGASLAAWKYKSNGEFIEPIATKLIQGDTTWTEVNVKFNTGSEPEYVFIVVVSNGFGCSWFDHVEFAQDDSVP